jgi:eukaryotic-like serine/threonine-protein kinase
MASSLDGARTLGSYQLLSQLAVGGMAEIYIARTHGVGGFEKLVALKVIHPNFSADPEFVQMLVDEAKLSVQLTHANIVQTFDLGRVDEQYYIAMELIDGIDLYKLLRRASEREIDFPFEVAAFIGAEVAQGLDYAHRKRDARGRPLKIVHRDVSPQNVLVSFDGEVKIVDFGIAKAALRGQQTAAGVIKGKYYYMSPEQAWGDPIDARTDIFSAGILLYEMLVGQMLYMEEDLERLLDVVRKAQIAPPSAHRAGVPAALEQIVMRCLKKRADDRWPTAGELGQALQQFLHSFAPDFSRARLATFVREVMGDDPTAAERDARSSTAHAPNAAGIISAIEVRDENSLIFSLSDLKPEPEAGKPRPAPPPTPPSQPRRADIPTNVRAGGDFEENEATIVDAGDTLLAHLGDGDNDRTRPAGPAVRRSSPQVPSGQFDLGADDPAADADLDAPTLANDEDDAPTGARELPSPRTHETRRVESPPLDEDDDPPTPQEIIDAPPALAAAPSARPARPQPARPQPQPQPAARQARPTPIAVRRHPNAPQPVNTKASTIPMPPVAQPNAPAATLDEADTKQRTRKAPPRPLAEAHPTFGDDAPEPTVAARGQQLHAQQQQAESSGRPPSQKVKTMAPPPPPPPSSNAAETLTLPPAQNPLGAAAAKPSQRLSFDEPTRIPPAQPPPLDSGRFIPGLDDGANSALSSLPLGEPDATLRPKNRSGVYIAIGILGMIAIGAAAAVIFAGGATSGGRGTLSIVSLPTGAEVRIDGVAGSELTPVTMADVDPRASHHVRVSKSGYDVWESDVKFPAGERELRVQMVLVPTVGTVEIVSQPPGAEAIVNGRIRGMTPATVGDLPPNDDVVIELRLRGYKVAHKTVSWAGKRVVQVSIPLEKAK